MPRPNAPSTQKATWGGEWVLSKCGENVVALASHRYSPEEIARLTHRHWSIWLDERTWPHLMPQENRGTRLTRMCWDTALVRFYVKLSLRCQLYLEDELGDFVRLGRTCLRRGEGRSPSPLSTPIPLALPPPAPGFRKFCRWLRSPWEWTQRDR